MKTFVALLAAGAIIFAAFVGWQRLDRWEQAKAYWTAQLRQAQANMPREIPRDIMVNLSVADLTEEMNRLNYATRAWTHAAHELRLYLENKPFGLPLTDEENRLLKITGGSHTENGKVPSQSEPTPTATPDTLTPTPTDTPTPTPTDTPTPTPTPDFIVLTRPVPIKIRYGVISLNPGTRLKLVSRAVTTARVQYSGAEYDIPLSSTDLAN